MSVAGFVGIFIFLVHLFSIAICLTFVFLTIKYAGNRRKFFGASLIVSIGLYSIWIGTKDNWKNDIGQKHVGKYELTAYPNCSDCILELSKDNSYKIYNKNQEFEDGTWSYFDDGDIGFIEFDNDGQLGFNKYAYRPK
ncbi:MAG: hypothetical protein NT150_12575 [Bacteroidetes bacterium]|nr:hypothetical protein [Bacteroidota bacterium]